MNVFWSLVFYVMIGGVFAASMNNHNVEQCGEYLDDNTTMIAVFGWPAIIPMVIIADEPNEYTTPCEENNES